MVNNRCRAVTFGVGEVDSLERPMSKRGIRSAVVRLFIVGQVIQMNHRNAASGIDGGADRTAEIAQMQGAKVVFEGINQISRSRNCGATAATGDWLIFIDADSHPTPELFSDVLEQIESDTCLAGGCTMRLAGESAMARRISGFWNFISRTFRLAAGSFIFCDVTAFRETGGFSNELFASEELDLSKRLKKVARKRGKKFVILHRHPLLTSARKLHLYSFREHFRVMWRATISGGKTLTLDAPAGSRDRRGGHGLGNAEGRHQRGPS